MSRLLYVLLNNVHHLRPLEADQTRFSLNAYAAHVMGSKSAVFLLLSQSVWLFVQVAVTSSQQAANQVQTLRNDVAASQQRVADTQQRLDDTQVGSFPCTKSFGCITDESIKLC